VGQHWPRASQEVCWGSGSPKDLDVGTGAGSGERYFLSTCSLHQDLRRLGFGGAGELGGARKPAGLKSVGEAEFSCKGTSALQTLIPARWRRGEELTARLSNRWATWAGAWTIRGFEEAWCRWLAPNCDESEAERGWEPVKSWEELGSEERDVGSSAGFYVCMRLEGPGASGRVATAAKRPARNSPFGTPGFLLRNH